MKGYERLVDPGRSDANLYLGEMYQRGEGVAVYISKAITFFEVYESEIQEY